MAKNRSRSLPPTKTVKELVGFFDRHDMGEYWPQLPEAEFDIHIKKRTHLITVAEDVFSELTKIAKSKGVSSKTLIDSWLKEKIRKAG